MASIQMHFEFVEWESAFSAYRENIEIGNEVVMIVSTNPHTSGYWVESKPNEFQLPKSDILYEGEAVDELETRVRAGVQLNEAVMRGAYMGKTTGLIV